MHHVRTEKVGFDESFRESLSWPAVSVSRDCENPRGTRHLSPADPAAVQLIHSDISGVAFYSLSSLYWKILHLTGI